jgi:hypothetical protein
MKPDPPSACMQAINTLIYILVFIEAHSIYEQRDAANTSPAALEHDMEAQIEGAGRYSGGRGLYRACVGSKSVIFSPQLTPYLTIAALFLQSLSPLNRKSPSQGNIA